MQQLIRGFREVEESTKTCVQRVKTIDSQFAEICVELKAGQTAVKEEISTTLNQHKAILDEKVRAFDQVSRENREVLTANLAKLKAELQQSTKEDVDAMKTFVVQSQAKASAHRETLQQAYDVKLDQVKDVCSSFFAQYESAIAQTQTQLRKIERAHQQWSDKLLKPFADSQAKMFGMETRFQETEQLRVQ